MSIRARAALLSRSQIRARLCPANSEPAHAAAKGAHHVKGGFNGSVYAQEGDRSVPLCDAGISVFAVSIQPFVGQCSGRHEAVACPAAESRWPTSRIAPYVHRQSIPSSRRGLEVTKPELGAGQRGTRRVDLGGTAFPQS